LVDTKDGTSEKRDSVSIASQKRYVHLLDSGGRKRCILFRIYFSVAYPFKSKDLPKVDVELGGC